MRRASLIFLSFIQGLERNLEDQLEIEYSPTYWLINNTVVPTTTQRTTVSTSTQGKTSLFSSSKSSNDIERITKATLGDLKHRIVGDEEDDDDEDDEDENKTGGAGAHGRLSVAFLLVTLSLLKALF
jgi:hypothetical protein